MKLDWNVEGTVAYKDSTVEGYNAKWVGLTLVEANERLDELTEGYMRRRKVQGISVP